MSFCLTSLLNFIYHCFGFRVSILSDLSFYFGREQVQINNGILVLLLKKSRNTETKAMIDEI